MIVPTKDDAVAFSVLRESRTSLSVLRSVAATVCTMRGEKPVVVMPDSPCGPVFHPGKWVIKLCGVAPLPFLHEIAHLVSFIDNGRPGNEEDAECFAHGVMCWLHPETYSCGSTRWFDADKAIVRKILWTREHLERIHSMEKTE
jgi:hypothetical protein